MPGKMQKPHSFADLNRGVSVMAASGTAAGEAPPVQQQRPPPPKAAVIDKATIRGMYGDLLQQGGAADTPATAPGPGLQNGNSHAPTAAANGTDQLSNDGSSTAGRDGAMPNGAAAPQAVQQGASPFQRAANAAAVSPGVLGSPSRFGGGDPGAKGLACVASLADGLPAAANTAVDADDSDRQDGLPRAASGSSLASAFATGAPPFTDSSDSDDAGSRPEGHSSIGRNSSDGSEHIVWSPPRQPQQRLQQNNQAQLPSRPFAVRFGSVVRRHLQYLLRWKQPHMLLPASESSNASPGSLPGHTSGVFSSRILTCRSTATSWRRSHRWTTWTSSPRSAAPPNSCADLTG